MQRAITKRGTTKRAIAGSAAALVAALLVFLATTPPGPGLDPDGMAYVGAATSFAHHGTFRVPTGEWSSPDSTSALSFWPPGYPVAIAGMMSGGTSAIQGARIVNVIAAAITAFAIVLLVASATNVIAGVIAALVVFVTPAVFDVHLSVLSEPLFLSWLVVALAAMVYARDRLMLLSVVSAAAVMTRYVGAGVPTATVLWTLGDSRYALRRRWRRAGMVASLPAMAIVAWVTRTALAKDRHGTPSVAVYGNWGVTIRQAWATAMDWLAPQVPDGSWRIVVTVMLCLGVLLLTAVTLRDTASSRFRQVQTERVAAVLKGGWLLVGTYLLVACVARAFVGGTIPFDWRILSPVIVLVEIVVVTSVAHWWRAYHRPVHVVIGVVGLAWIVAAGTVSANDGYYAATEGADFADVAWRDSPLIAWVRTSGGGHTLYSNWPPAVYFHAHRIARMLPDSTEVPGELADFSETLRETNGVIVGFDEKSPDVVAPDSIAKLLGLRQIVRFSDGAIWGL